MEYEVYFIDFDELVRKYDLFLKYAVNSSDYLSFITYQKKPYSQIPPNCEHDMITDPLTPYMVKQIVGIREWANDSTNDNHRVMNIYECQPRLRKTLEKLGNMLLSVENNLPEDICFYRNKDVWISTVIHEKIVYIYHPNEEDIAFFQKNNINIQRYGTTDSLYQLDLKKQIHYV